MVKAAWSMARLSWREALGEPSRDRVHSLGRHRPWGIHPLREPPGIQERVALEGQLPEQRQLGIDEAEGAAHRYVASNVRQPGFNPGNLLGEPVDQLGLVTSGDGELRPAEERPADGDLARVVLGVNHPDPGRRDRDVVNVGGTVRDSAIVQKRHSRVEVLGQRPRDALLSLGTPSPCLLVLRLTLNGQLEPAETWVLRADPRVTVGPTTRVLTTCAGARDATVEVGVVVRGAHTMTPRRVMRGAASRRIDRNTERLESSSALTRSREKEPAAARLLVAGPPPVSPRALPRLRIRDCRRATAVV